MAAPTYNPDPSPKEKFLLEGDAAKHLRALESEDLIRWLDIALLHYQWIITRGDLSPEQASASYHQLSGARQFVTLFKNLSRRNVSVVSKPEGHLNHKV